MFADSSQAAFSVLPVLCHVLPGNWHPLAGNTLQCQLLPDNVFVLYVTLLSCLHKYPPTTLRFNNTLPIHLPALRPTLHDLRAICDSPPPRSADNSSARHSNCPTPTVPIFASWCALLGPSIFLFTLLHAPEARPERPSGPRHRRALEWTPCSRMLSGPRGARCTQSMSFVDSVLHQPSSQA